MGALAVMVDEWKPTLVPERFTFSDENPVTLEPYAECVIGDLPPWVETVITDVVGLSPAEWDALVEKGETYTAVGPEKEYPLTGFLATVAARAGKPAPAGVCPDCWGTWASADPDGAATGQVGRAIFCSCVGM